MNDELMQSYLSVFDGDEVSVNDRISKLRSTPPPDLEQQETCLKKARKAFTSLCQLSTSFRLAHPSDHLTSLIRELHNFQGPAKGFRETLATVLDNDTVGRQLEKHVPWVCRERQVLHANHICLKLRAIFSILIYAGMPSRILRFLEYGVHDEHLPILKVSISDGSRALSVRPLQDSTRSVHACIQGWTQDEIRRFDLAQWSTARISGRGQGRGEPEFVLLPFEEVVPRVPEREVLLKQGTRLSLHERVRRITDNFLPQRWLTLARPVLSRVPHHTYGLSTLRP